MKDIKTFQEIYETLQNENSQEINEIFEEAKKEKNKLNKLQLILCIVIDIIVVCLSTNFFQNMNLAMIILPILIADFSIYVFTSTFLGKKQREYNLKFKRIAINKLMDNFYDNIEYYPTKQMPERIYEEAKYNETYNQYTSEDYLEATLDGKYLNMAEVETIEVETHKDSEGNTKTTTDIKFHGLFAKIMLEKSINSQLKIARNNTFKFSKERLEMDSRRI